MEALERQMIAEALERHHGNVTHAARELGLTRQGLILKRRRYGAKKNPYADNPEGFPSRIWGGLWRRKSPAADGSILPAGKGMHAVGM